MFLADKWEDITSRVRQSSTITITRGRKDENTKTPPATCMMTLDNSDGAFSLRNPLGPWYGKLSRNNPIEVTKRLVTDSFSRTVASGWGSADTGQSWGLLSGTGTTSVAPSGAVVNVSTVNTIMNMYVIGVSQADASVAAEFSIPVTDVTGDFVVPGGVFVRGTTAPDHIYARVQVNTDETLTLGLRSAAGTVYINQVATGLTNAAGRRFGVRIIADGDTIAAKLWLASAGEPVDWMVTATERAKSKGLVGIRTGIGGSSTNSPMAVTYYSFSVDSVRFTGEVSNFPAASDTTGRDQYVQIEAAGIRRRLGQGQAPTLSAIRRGVLSVNPVAYWPCEEGENATGIGAATVGTQPANIYPLPNLPDFAVNDDFLCSAPLPTLNGSTVACLVPPYDSSAGEAQTRVLFSVPAGGIPADESVIRVYTQGASFLWDVVLQPDGNLRVDAYNPAGVQIYAGGAIGFGLNGTQVRMSFELKKNGANVDFNLSTLSQTGVAGGISATVAGTSFNQVDSIYIGSKQTAPDLVFGHVTFENAITNIFTIASQLQAYVGERALTRMIRLSSENEVPFYYNGVPGVTMEMGAQRIKTYAALVEEAGDSDVGTVHERRGLFGVAYRTRTSAYAQSDTVTLDLSKFQVGMPFRPVDDDQLARNDVTVNRAGGGEFRAVLESGPMSVLEPPNGIGRYDDAPELSLKTDTQLPDLAGWLLALGTVNEARYPGLRIDLDAPAVVAAALAPSTLDLDVDDRLSIINPSSFRIYDPIHQIVRGYTELLGNHQHVFTLNLSPSSPYDIGVLDDNLYRLDSGSSSLTSALAKGATGSASVTTTDSADLWTTSGAFFPMDIMIGGERITISGISGATSPQTFTVSARAVNGVAKEHSAGSAVHVADPWRLGL